MVVKRLDILRFAAFAMVIIFASIFKNEILAQTDAQFTQYWAVPSYYNPGAAGDTDFIRIRGGAKLQWTWHRQCSSKLYADRRHAV